MNSLLSPTPPFLAIAPRLRLVGIFIAVGLVTPFTSSYWIIKASAFAVGFAFFGDPVFQSTVKLLNEKIPDWKKYLDMQMYAPPACEASFLLLIVTAGQF